ncbi:gamma-glutamylcyclotransferase family protein [Flavobacterium sp. ASW18X]|uniref:gamma-glutamylcyclotransferase family protein n=1 Tax=Flavobacterium sp. ASW18X TaxID=2572595 RepID=UPI0010AE9B41|nr:gamma-glutamylcyclotransferase family protein [Flavobacterium sp. ASW18X]TKD66491.1 gamma-glutamylcyclotransferase [Flavobacterium sp. ASW18X]
MNPTHLIFSYGTLQEPKVQIAIYERLLQGHKAILPNYTLANKKMYGQYPVVIPNSGLCIAGVAYEINEAELALTDAYEGPDYTRSLLPLANGKKAWVYLEKPQ